MYRLTDNRLLEAKQILEKYRDELFHTRTFRTSVLEHELRELWDIGYQELKGIMIDMLRHEHYREVAAYHMEHSNAPGVVAEFQTPLANLYGIERFHAAGRDEHRNRFWDGVFAGT